MVNDGLLSTSAGASEPSHPQAGNSNDNIAPQPSFAFEETISSSQIFSGMSQEVPHNPFDILEWHPAYQSCQRYFINHSQYHDGTMAVAAFVNILLPHQWHSNPITTLAAPSHTTSPIGAAIPSSAFPRPGEATSSRVVSLLPYIRRLVVTGFDKDPILHGFFGDDWRKGVGPMQECERRNYLFAAKSGGWNKVKAEYDMGPHETVPFLLPPQNVHLLEIESAERQWSEWLSVEDWMVGPRAPGAWKEPKPEPRT